MKTKFDSLKPAKVKPPFSYIGGKGRFSDWIISLMPPHKRYVEVFGGSGAILLAKPPARHDVYNDIDGNLWNFFNVVRDEEKCQRLIDALEWTPYSRTEHAKCKKLPPTDDDVEKARRYWVLVCQSFQNKYANSWSSGTKDRTSMYRQYRTRFEPIRQRFDKVAIECQSYEKLFPKYDSTDTLWYLDPPYVMATRGKQKYYRHDDWGDEQQREFLLQCKKLKGKVMISGYPSEIYDEVLKGWRTEIKPAVVSGFLGTKTVKNETLWMNWGGAK